MGKFNLGQLVATHRVAERAEKDLDFYNFIHESIRSYISGDWGKLCDEDKRSNDNAVKNGERILAAYIYSETDEKIWIITGWDRSVTTILFPDEY